MSHQRLWGVLFCVCFLFLACVSKNKFVAAETELAQTQARLDQNYQQLAALQTKYDKLRATNTELLNTIEDLKLLLRQEKTAVLQKEQEIASLDLIRKNIEATLQEELTAKEQKVSELEKMRMGIETSLAEQIAAKDIKIEAFADKLRITFIDQILFNSGSVVIKSKGSGLLLRLAEPFKDAPNYNIVVEGHTDDVQIGKSLQEKFPTNWELSAARAAAVVRFLQDEAGIAPHRMTASGLSYYRPVASNETEEGRRENRRIEINLVPRH